MMEYRFRPRPLSISAYNRALDEFISKYASHPDVLGIYQFGSVRIPGISDLDFIVVVSEELSQPITRDFGYDYFSEETSYILTHNPIIVPIDLFPNLWKLYPIFGKIKCRYGEDASQAFAVENLSQDYAAHNLMAICFRHYPWFFLFLRRRGFLDVRTAIQVVNALNHARSLSERIDLDTFKHKQDFFEDIDELQRNWFDMPASQKFDMLDDLIGRAAEISAVLVQDLALYAKSHIGRIESNHRASLPRLIGRYHPGNYLFLDLPGEIDLLSLTKKVWQETGDLMSVLPKEFLIPLLLLEDAGGQLGRVVALNLSTSVLWREKNPTEAFVAGLDVARLFKKLYQFFEANPISLVMSPDSFRVSELSIESSRHLNNSWPIRSFARVVRNSVHSVRLRRAGISTTKLKPRTKP